MSIISTRLQSIKPSPTLSIAATAAKLRADGIDIISLSTGEPDFDTPDNIKAKAKEAMNAGLTKYTPVAGMPKLKQAVCDKFKRENNLDYNLNEVIVSTGGKQVIYNLFMATLNVEDEVIIPAPYWVSYPDMVLLAGGKPIIATPKQKDNFKITVNELESKITNKTKWLLLNSPSNPSGATYNENELQQIAEMLRKYPRLHIMCDDIYEHIIYDNFQFKTLANIAPDLKSRIFIINGVSKAYAMTGWRIGYGAGTEEIIKAMTIIQSQSTSGASSISQAAALEALNGTQDYIKPNVINFQKKRDLVLSKLAEITGISCNKPEGAFYLFPNCSSVFGNKTPQGKTINSSADFATYLLEVANVAIVPGIAFGMEGYFRLSYATSEELLIEACRRINEAMKQLV
ncbi:MAG: pyridoxal phosphate-dependent aminotransferase [Rickettsiaceae bacterium]|nr:pyridoxal phosphate-dependent aminotransferase [Rickettsiaceae bacterium]